MANDRDSIVSLYKKCKVAKEQLLKDHGLIMKIRADEWSARGFAEDPDGCVKWFLDAHRENVCHREQGEAVVRNCTKPVGYFVACCPEGCDHIQFGMSICSPKDDFNKDKGLLLAIDSKRLYKLNVGTSAHGGEGVKVFTADDLPRFAEKDYQVLWHNGKTIARFWPITLKEQFEVFCRKAAAYYKQFAF